MNSQIKTAAPLAFKAGDPVVILYQGLYNGSRGHYIGLREDPLWVDVEESDGSVGSHPLAWLRRPGAFHDADRKAIGE